MKTYQVYGIATVSKHLGKVKANSPEEAEKKAWSELSNEMHISICHHCSKKMGDTPEITELQVEEA